MMTIKETEKEFFLQIIRFYEGAVLPTVIWDPRMPIFSCKDPVIHVKLQDQLNFVCPGIELNAYIGDQDNPGVIPFENLYFLGTDYVAFQTCNATDCRKLLHCSFDRSAEDAFTLVFRNVMTGPNALTFKEGQIYHFIGTGYRLKEHLNDTIGGSCNRSEEDKYHKLRLKIYVCTQEDIQKGKCNTCQSEGCYYRDCSISCTEWTNERLMSKDQNCSMLQKRQCYNALLSKTEQEYRETFWSCDKEPPTGVTSFELKRSAIQSDGTDSKKYQHLALGLSVFTFVFGILVGVIIYRWYYLKYISSKTRTNQGCTNQGISSTTAVENKHSFYSSYEDMYGKSKTTAQPPLTQYY